MTRDTNRQWLLGSRPQGMAAESNFVRRDSPCPPVTDGHVLVRTLYLSVDPAMRGWMTEDPDYMPPIPLGSVMPASALGQVVESRHADFRPGDFVSGVLGWQDYHLSDGPGPTSLSTFEPVHPLPMYLGVLGGTGLTAYFGMREVARPKAGETVVVSGRPARRGPSRCRSARSPSAG